MVYRGWNSERAAFLRQRDRAGLLALSPVQSMPVSAALTRVHTSLASKAYHTFADVLAMEFFVGFAANNSEASSIRVLRAPSKVHIQLEPRPNWMYSSFLCWQRTISEWGELLYAPFLFQDAPDLAGTDANWRFALSSTLADNFYLNAFSLGSR